MKRTPRAHIGTTGRPRWCGAWSAERQDAQRLPQPYGDARAAVGHADVVSKQRYLFLHDYGMGGLWWWIHARSTREVLETFAEVEVVDEPADVARAMGWGLEEVDIDAAAMPLVWMGCAPSATGDVPDGDRARRPVVAVHAERFGP
jgi:hypothetical protein